MEKISGAQALIKALLNEGVDTIFGYPGGAIIPVFDAMYDFEKAGFQFAIKQINDLLQNGVNGIHIYTMNKPHVARTVLKGITR